MTPESNVNQSDPMVGLRSLIPQGSLNEPSAEQMSAGVLDGLRQVLSIVTTAAETVPDLAPQAKDIKNLAMQMMLRVQTMTGQGSEGGGY